MSQRANVTLDNVKEMVRLQNQGMTTNEIAKAVGRAPSTVGRALAKVKPQKLIAMPAPIPTITLAPREVSFDYAVTLLKKATAIVEALAQQQKPPELMALVRDTVEAAVKLELANSIAAEVEAAKGTIHPEPVVIGTPVPAPSWLDTQGDRLLIARR